MTLLLSVLGVALNALVIRDIFHTLFAPTGTGALTSFVARHVWHLSRHVERRRPTALALAGPVALLCIIALWALSLALGWAFIIWPHMPTAFSLPSGTDGAGHSDFVEALYLSLVTLATLGYGDIVPHTAWLKMIVPLEALIGFSLGTASVSWILSIYPVLARRRHLARTVFLLQRSERRGDDELVAADSGALSAILLDLAGEVISLRNDLVQVPITYYFHTPDRGSAIEVALLDLASLARRAGYHDNPVVRFHAALLHEALSDLATHVAEAFLDKRQGTMEEVLDAYAVDHGHVSDLQVRQAEVSSDIRAER